MCTHRRKTSSLWLLTENKSCTEKLKVCVCVSLTGQQLDNSGENESLSLLEPEELKDEDEEADAT